MMVIGTNTKHLTGLRRLLIIITIALLYSCNSNGPNEEAPSSSPDDIVGAGSFIAPVNFSASAQDGAVTLSWNPVLPADSYVVYRHTDSSLSVSNYTSTSVVGTPYKTISGLDNGTQYFFAVLARKGDQESDLSLIVSATPKSDLKLLPPVGLYGLPQNNAVILSWNPVLDAHSYEVYWDTNSAVSETSYLSYQDASDSPITIDDLTNDTTYYFAVLAKTGNIKSKLSSVTNAIIPKPPVLGKPENLVASSSGTSVSLVWGAVTDGSNYKIYWSKNSDVSTDNSFGIKDTTSPSVTINGLDHGSTYYFIVLAYNPSSGAYSPVSDAVNATIFPDVPTGVQVTPANASVTVDWSAVTGASGYTVYWGGANTVSKSSHDGSQDVTNTTTSALVSGLVNGQTYYFIVTAKNAGGESTESSPSQAAIPIAPPPAPTGLKAVLDAGNVTLSWNGTCTSSCQYKVYWDTNAGVSTTSDNSADATSAAVTLTNLSAGATYYFIVTERNAGGESPASASASVLIPSLLAAPTGLTAVAEGGRVKLTWTSTCTSLCPYKVYWDTNTGVSVNSSSNTNTGSTAGSYASIIFDSPGQANATYYFVVTVSNAAGESAASKSASVFVPPPPATPAITQILPGDGLVILVWSEIAGAGITYNVYHQSKSFGDSPTKSDLLAATKLETGTGTTQAVVQLANSTPHYFVVAAYSAVAGEGGVSDELSATPVAYAAEETKILVYGGDFTMGCSESSCLDNEKPTHLVTLGDFYIGKFEVTQEEYAAFLNDKSGVDAQGEKDGTQFIALGPQITYDGSRFIVTTTELQHPVTAVTYAGATAYAAWVAGRLPTEAEWEYAAAGGVSSKGYTYAGSDNPGDIAWHNGNTNALQQVGTRLPNELGIHDMSGNAQEWVRDTYLSNYYGASPRFDPLWLSGLTTLKSLRGGSYLDDILRITARNGASGNVSLSDYGFRVVWPITKLNDTGVLYGGDVFNNPITGDNSPYSISNPVPESQFNCPAIDYGADKISGTDDDTPLEAQDCGQGRDVTHNNPVDGLAGFSFTKLNDQGQPLADQTKDWDKDGSEAASTQWSCVRDNVTGLIWERKNTFGTPPGGNANADGSWPNSENIHHADNKYRWGGITSVGYNEADTDGANGHFKDWNSLVNGSNADRLCGYTDWRVPTTAELWVMRNLGRRRQIDEDYFKLPQLPNFVPVHILSADLQQYYQPVSLPLSGLQPGIFGLLTGTAGGEAQYYLWLVRGGR